MLKLKDLLTEDPILGKTGVVGLSKIDKGTAKAAVGTGLGDGDPADDKVPGKYPKKIPAKNLRASQTEIILTKAFNMAMNSKEVGGEYPAGGDIGAIASGDKPNAYIMDGHHRWAATFLVKPNANIDVTQINLPGEALVHVLNTYTVGGLGIADGNTGQGDVAEVTGENIQTQILDVAAAKGKAPDSPDGKAPGLEWEELQRRLTILGNGDLQAGIDTIKQNADDLPKAIMPNAPARVDMPVIDKDKVADVKAKLEKGEIDIKEPHSPEVKAAMGEGKQLKEHFQKIANIKKG